MAHWVTTGRECHQAKTESLQKSKEDNSQPPSSISDYSSSSEVDQVKNEISDASTLIEAARNGASRQLKEERRTQRQATKAEAMELARERNKKHVRLNKLTSISGSGTSKGASNPNVECYNCGTKGHTAKLCPEPNRKGQSRKTQEHILG